MALIETHGPSNWVRISQLLVTRTPKQCRERYHQNLKPSLNHSPITEEEGLYIEQLVQRYGKKWAEIARHLNGRSDNAVKNWWNGGANRRRRVSVTGPPSGSSDPTMAMANQNENSNQNQNQNQNQTKGQNENLVRNQAQSSTNGQPLPSQASLPSINLHALPPHNVTALPPLEYSYPSVGQRVSLPNIYSDYPNHAPPPPPPPPRFDPQGHPPPVVFNSAYTASDSSGFRKSSAVSTSTPVDPRNQDVPPHSQGPLNRSPYAARKRLTNFDDSPYSRRMSASAIVPASSSRTSSVSGISNSDTEDPLTGPQLSLSKYSLSNSGSSSRRNSHAVPTDTSGKNTPLLTPHSGIPLPLSSYTRHSVSGYLDPLEPTFVQVNPGSKGTDSTSGSSSLANTTTTTSSSPTISSEHKIKISNLLS